MRPGKPSQTAIKVATNIVTLGSKPAMAGILPPGSVESTEALLRASGAVSGSWLRLARSRWTVSLYDHLDRFAPGQFEGLGRRKAFCEHQVRAAIDDGARQALVLGAGFDTLAWRLSPEFPDVHFVELDHPATGGDKQRGIDALGHPPNLTLLQSDLTRHSVRSALEHDRAWDRHARSVFVAEGLLMYLPPLAVRDLLQQLADVGGPNSRLAFSYVATRPDGRPDAGAWTSAALWFLRWVGEPWLWSHPPQTLGTFLWDCGWELQPQAARPYARGGVEHFAVASSR